MLKTGLEVLEKQKPVLNTALERKNFIRGKKNLQEKFTKRIYNKLALGHKSGQDELLYLFRYNKPLFVKYLIGKILFSFRHKAISQLEQSK
jgi:hypothetical protein